MHDGSVTVVLADDHAVVRKGLRLLVESELGMRVVAEAGPTLDAILEHAQGTAIVIVATEGAPSRSPRTDGRPDDLSDRELEVLRLIALGHTNAEIAEQLYLSVRTIESHRAHIQRKTCRASRAELVRYAVEHRLVHLRSAP